MAASPFTGPQLPSAPDETEEDVGGIDGCQRRRKRRGRFRLLRSGAGIGDPNILHGAARANNVGFSLDLAREICGISGFDAGFVPFFSMWFTSLREDTFADGGDEDAGVETGAAVSATGVTGGSEIAAPAEDCSRATGKIFGFLSRLILMPDVATAGACAGADGWRQSNWRRGISRQLRRLQGRGRFRARFLQDRFHALHEHGAFRACTRRRRKNGRRDRPERRRAKPAAAAGVFWAADALREHLRASSGPPEAVNYKGRCRVAGARERPDRYKFRPSEGRLWHR